MKIQERTGEMVASGGAPFPLLPTSVPHRNDSMGWRLELALKRRKVRKSYPLALEIGVSESCISRWRRGCSISTDNAIKLCHALDISLDWLLSGRGSMDQHRQRAVDDGEYALIERLRRLPERAHRSLHALLDFLEPYR